MDLTGYGQATGLDKLNFREIKVNTVNNDIIIDSSDERRPLVDAFDYIRLLY